MEVRRFLRLRNTVLSICAPTEPAQEGQRRSATKEPWKDKKYGYTPFAKHDRVKFMNDEVLPTFYASQWKYAKNQKDFVKKFHSEGRRQYEIRKNVLRVSQRLENVCREKNPASAGKFLSSNYKLKAKDLTFLTNNLKTVEEIQQSANKVREGIAKEDALLFTKSTNKLKTGNECAHQFHEKCFSTLNENDKKVLEMKEKLEELVKKHKNMYKFLTRGNLKTNSRQVKEGRTKARTRKMKRMTANMENILSNISSSYRSSGVVEDLDLSKIQLLTLRQAKWIRCVLKSGKLAENFKRTFLENLKPVVKKAIAEASDSDSPDADSPDDDSDEGSGNEESCESGERVETGDDEDSEDEVGAEEQEEEAMTVEQAELMEQYTNDFVNNF